MLSGGSGGPEIIRFFEEYDIFDQNTDSTIKNKK